LLVSVTAGAPVFAQTVPAGAGPAANGDEGLSTIVVDAKRIGTNGLIEDRNDAKAVSAVSADFIGGQAPTENAFQLISLLPGANVGSSDPYGISSASRLVLRGLGQDEIGVLMQGAPQNDIGNYFAYPSQFVDPENIRQVSLTPGSVDLDSPIINGAGGLLAITLTDPAETFGGQADVSYGSFNERRSFLRVDSGRVGDLRAFISYSSTGADNWRGPGRDKKQHIDFNVVDEWGQGNRVSLSASLNDAVTTGYPQPTLDQWRRSGRNFNYDSSYSDGDTNYWRQYVSTFRDIYVSAPSTFTLTDRLTLDVTPYVQRGYGNSPYGTWLSTTGNYFGAAPVAGALVIPGAQDGGATVLGNYTGDQYRAGVTSKLSYRVGHHTLLGGFWYDYADDKDVESFTPLDSGGNPVDLWGYQKNAIKMPNGQLFTVLDDHTVTQIGSLFVADKIALLDDKLQIDVGFKAVEIGRNGTNGLPGPQYHVSLHDFQPLPRAALRYQITSAHQIFADVTTNFRSPNSYALYDTYSGGVLTGTGNAHLKDEYSIAEEVGYRFKGEVMTASVSLFNYNFTNRQITTILLVNGAQVNSTINGGGQTSRGLDIELGLRPIHGFTPYLSGEYLDATIDDNIASNGDFVRTAGRTAVRSPHLQLAAGVSYDEGAVFGNVTVKYLGPQYATFTNDEKLPGHGQLDAMIGYHLPSAGYALSPDIRLNLINVTDEKFLSGVASPTLNGKATTGVYGTQIAGAAPTYYVGTGFAAVGTLSSKF
ncbi:MAG: TonB-dependent receptor plug domain-containing protein, partial [Methanobacterium sp.]|nr:TonB-dependent receptor plug domain-containing protein [Methanobacterium sp.]